MSGNVNGVALAVFLFFFLAVTVMGFAAARWRRGHKVVSLDEWGLGGRGFGGVVSWFLMGGYLYTAYTFIAVPALVFGTGETLVLVPPIWTLDRATIPAGSAEFS